MRFQASQTLSTCFFGFRLTSAGTIERFSIHKMGENAPSTHFLAYTFFSGVRWRQLSKEMGWRGLDTKQGEHEKDFPFCYSGPETKATNTKKKQREKLEIEDDGRAAVSAPVHSLVVVLNLGKSCAAVAAHSTTRKLKIKLGMLNFSWFFYFSNFHFNYSQRLHNMLLFTSSSARSKHLRRHSGWSRRRLV